MLMRCESCGKLFDYEEARGFCPGCGQPCRQPERIAAVLAGAPQASFRRGRGPSAGARRAGRIAVLLMMLAALVLLAFAALGGLPGMGSFLPPEPQPEWDAAGSLRLLPVDSLPRPLPKAALETVEEAAQTALYAIYGSAPVTGEMVPELFCNLSEGGYANPQALAAHLRETCTGRLGQWDGRLIGRPLIRGNRAYLDVMLYTTLNTAAAPYSFDRDLLTDELLVCMLWSGSEWLVDAGTRAEDMLREHPYFLYSDGFSRSLEDGLACFFFLGPGVLAEPVIPQVCDTLIREVYATADGGAVISCWAYNGLDEPVDIDALDEVYLARMDGPCYCQRSDYPIRPLHLEPREGRVLTIRIPPEDMLRPLGEETMLTARVRLVDCR